MIRHVFSFILALGACFGPAAQAQPRTPAKSLLWEITGRALDTPSYIMGTIHMVCPDDYLWTPAMASALRGAKTICLELDLDDPETVRGMISGGPDTTGGKTLRESLSPEEYARFARFARDSAGIEIAGIEAMDPATVPLLFLTKLLPCSVPVSYEAKIAMDAMGGRKPIEGLETVAEQMALLSRIQNDSSAGDIMALVDSFSAMKGQYAELVATFRRQDLDSLQRMIEASPMLGASGDALLGDRNRRWIPRLESFMKQGAVFVAVGAGHLPGRNGVLELLRQAGYTVRPL